VKFATAHYLAAAFLGAAGFAFVPTVAVGAAPAAAPGGEAIFEQRCASCHSVEPGENDVGPSLAGVVGRKAGGLVGYSYSAALKASGKVWTRPQLDQFLANPQKLVPGTRMATGVPAADQRQALIAYLAAIH
jgi:cytochrome c